MYVYLCVFDFFRSLAILNSKSQRPNCLPVSVVLVSYTQQSRKKGNWGKVL